MDGGGVEGIVGGYTEVLRTVDGEWMVVNEAYKIVYGVEDLNYQATRLWVNGRRTRPGPAVVVETRAELEDDATSGDGARAAGRSW